MRSDTACRLCARHSCRAKWHNTHYHDCHLVHNHDYDHDYHHDYHHNHDYYQTNHYHHHDKSDDYDYHHDDR